MTIRNRSQRNIRRLKIGYVPLIDCAPFLVAQEKGFFARYDLNVELSREPGWATIRDKVIYGELDAAHAVAGMPFAATLGLGSIVCECATALVLNLHGNAITLSKDLYDRGVRDARTLKQVIDRDRGERTCTFGVVYPFSSHNFLLRQWLRSGRIDPDKDVHIVVVPPPQMFANLRAGNLDGYCVGEPWNSVAVRAGIGWCVTTSAELAPNHPEKVLMVRKEFLDHHADEHTRLVAAMLEACDYCDNPEHRDELVNILSRPAYLNVPAQNLRQSLTTTFDCGYGRTRASDDFLVFHKHGANEPSLDKAAWVINHLIHSGMATQPDGIVRGTAAKVFRQDLYEEGHQMFAECRRPLSIANAGNQPLVV
jgi:ABC-type nitrate/sulfonate/bicarbonate transport system substrate-binding protein